MMEPLSVAKEIMAEFADETGLAETGEPPRRYLWTDAFAVCNFFTLFQETGHGIYRELALGLIQQVHRVLGRHRPDDTRSGWISGLSEAEGGRHPTAGGLRIGKRLNERGPGEPFDERLEWDRDGQYYHYLTKWMYTLDLATQATGNGRFNRWARELASTAHARFTYDPGAGGPRRMYWKMSIDLSRPLVPSMGHHDPLDGLITYAQLQSTAMSANGYDGGPDLKAEIGELAGICEGIDWATDDPLGIGGLLWDACRVGRLIVSGSLVPSDHLGDLLAAALPGVESYMMKNPLRMPPEYRLAFRELGLSIGLKAARRLQGIMADHPEIFPPDHPAAEPLEGLLRHALLGKRIEAFWLDPENRKADTWTEHLDINRVMLATSLAPEGFLGFG